MKKRGQVTVFLAIGVVLLLLVATLLFINSRVTKDNLETNLQAPETLQLRPQVSFYVESCLRDVVEPGIYLLGIQGGVIYPENPDIVLLTENALINYAYLNGVKQLSISKMEEDLARFVEESIDYCLDDLSVFAERGINVEKRGAPEVEVTITRNNVETRLNYELRAENGDDSTTIDSFSTRVPIQVGRVIEEAEKIIEKHEKNSELLNFPKNSETLQNPLNYNFALFPFDSSTFIYSISDRNSVVDEAPFTMFFAIQDINTNTAPVLEQITDFVIRQGLELEYKLSAQDAEGDLLTYSSSNSQIPITPEGIIRITFQQAGTYTTTFTVKDERDLQDTQEVKFIVE